jgi:hypothetical protein
MSLPSDLLSQARHLLVREPRRPRQASLRRAISTAYYALFHLLTSQASRMLVSSDPLQLLVSRTFTHTEMYKVRWTPLSRPKSDDSSLPSHQSLVILLSGRPWRRGTRRGRKLSPDVRSGGRASRRARSAQKPSRPFANAVCGRSATPVTSDRSPSPGTRG